MTEAEFTAIVGTPPYQDDLERANCKLAGQAGHYGCGICRHGRPVNKCQPCFVAAHTLR